jgi:hypothetical protein
MSIITPIVVNGVTNYPVFGRGRSIPFQPKRYEGGTHRTLFSTEASPGVTSEGNPYTVMGYGYATDAAHPRCWEYSSHGGECQTIGHVVMPVVVQDFGYNPPRYAYTLSFCLASQYMPTGLKEGDTISIGILEQLIHLDILVVSKITDYLLYVEGGWQSQDLGQEFWTDQSLLAGGWSWIDYTEYDDYGNPISVYSHYDQDLAQGGWKSGTFTPNYVYAGNNLVHSKSVLRGIIPEPTDWDTQLQQYTYTRDDWYQRTPSLLNLVWGVVDPTTLEYIAICGCRCDCNPQHLLAGNMTSLSDEGWGTDFPDPSDPTPYTVTLLNYRPVKWFSSLDTTTVTLPSGHKLCHGNVLTSNDGTGTVSTAYQQIYNYVDPRTNTYTGRQGLYWCCSPCEQYSDIFSSRPIGTQQFITTHGNVKTFIPNGCINLWMACACGEDGLVIYDGIGDYNLGGFAWGLTGDTRYFQDVIGNWVDKAGYTRTYTLTTYYTTGYVAEMYVYDIDIDHLWSNNDPWSPNKIQVSFWKEPNDTCYVACVVVNGTIITTPQICTGNFSQLKYTGNEIVRHYMYGQRTGWRDWPKNTYPTTFDHSTALTPTAIACDRPTQGGGSQAEYPMFYRGIIPTAFHVTIAGVVAKATDGGTQYVASDYVTPVNGTYTLGFRDWGVTYSLSYERPLCFGDGTKWTDLNCISSVANGSNAPFSSFTLTFAWAPDLRWYTVHGVNHQCEYGGQVLMSIDIGEAGWGPNIHAEQLIGGYEYIAPEWDDQEVWHNRDVSLVATNISVSGITGTPSSANVINDWSNAIISVQAYPLTANPIGGEFVYNTPIESHDVTSICRSCEGNQPDLWVSVTISGCSTGVDSDLACDFSALNGQYILIKQHGSGITSSYAIIFPSPIGVLYEGAVQYLNSMCLNASNYGSGGTLLFNSCSIDTNVFFTGFTNVSMNIYQQNWSVGPCSGSWSPMVVANNTFYRYDSWISAYPPDEHCDYGWISGASASIQFLGGQ